MKNTEKNDLKMGNIETLYKILTSLRLNSPDELDKALEEFTPEEDRDLSSQIIDFLLRDDNTTKASKENLIQLYKEQPELLGPHVSDPKNVFDFFSSWSKTEKKLLALTGLRSIKSSIDEITKNYDARLALDIFALFKFRNRFVHEYSDAELEQLQYYTSLSNRVYENLDQITSTE